MKVYSALFQDFAHLDKFYGGKAHAIRSREEVTKPGILILHGGSDISPSLYGEPVNGAVASNSPSPRDKVELELLTMWTMNKWPVLGICRGMQLMTAAYGGKLIQHVNNHAGHDHWMEVDTGEQIPVNSYHHQMCNVSNIKGAKVVGWAPEKLSDVYVGGPEPEQEAEAVFFEEHNAFAVQWHPEWLKERTSAVQWLFSQLESKIKRV